MPISTPPCRHGRGVVECFQRWRSACPLGRVTRAHAGWRLPPTAGSAGPEGSGRVSGSPESDRDLQPSRLFAVLLNHLFATRLAPRGRPYTLTEVSKATGLSVPYLSLLRKGTIGAVSLQ